MRAAQHWGVQYLDRECYAGGTAPPHTLAVTVNVTEKYPTHIHVRYLPG